MAVQDIINDQQNFASGAVADAGAFLDRLLNLTNASSIVIEGIPMPEYVSRDNSALAKELMLSLRPDAPALFDITGTLPGFTPGTITIPDAITVPDFTGNLPALDIPVPPSSTLPQVPAAPSITDPTIPSAPNITLPVSPTVGVILLPEVPSITIPTFDAERPINDLVQPTTMFTFAEQAYESAVLDALKAKLLDDLTNGTYGFVDTDEEALYNRARERESEAAASNFDTIFIQQAQRGFPLPPGDTQIALDRARGELHQKVSSLSRDIMIKRNDQYVEMYKFTITEARGLETISMNFHSSMMERSLNAAKATVDAAVALFNASVQKFNAEQEAYRTDAQVFESRIRASLAQVEVYRTQMQGKQIEADIQRTAVEVYRAQLDGINAVVNLYKTQMEAAQVQANIEQVRIAAFRALIDAYTSQVQAKVAEFNMFDARVRGELSKVQVYESQARAYSSVVAGKQAQAQVLLAQLNGQVERERANIEQFKARVDAYRADLAGQTATVTSRIQGYQADIQSYAAAVGALGEAYRLELNAQNLEDQVNLRNKDVAFNNARLAFEGLKTVLDTNVRAASTAGTYYSALVAGAVNSINTLAALNE